MDPTEFYRHLPTLTTPHLLLRKLRPADSAAYFTLAGDAQVTRYLRWGPHASPQESARYIAAVLQEYEDGSDGPWGIELKAGGALIGALHLMNLDTRRATAEVGVVLARRYWRQGLGKEALRSVLAFCFRTLKLRRVEGWVLAENVAACRLMESVGMILEKDVRDAFYQKGKNRDFKLYAIEDHKKNGLTHRSAPT